MAINGLLFLMFFLPVSLILFWVWKAKYRKVQYGILILLSLIFYLCNSVQSFLLICISIGINVWIAYIIERKKKRYALVIGCCYNVGILFLFKYLLFFTKNINAIFSAHIKIPEFVLPLGISFFTFKCISLLVDTYKEKITIKGNLLEATLYLIFFPQITSGPISRYGDMWPGTGYIPNKAFVSQGAYRFVLGFSKKVLLADMLGKIVNEIYALDPTSELSISMGWFGSICFSLQLFYDFSGYSDMAIGLSNMFGFSCPENFDYPYMTSSVSEFWRRWHITLGAWFRDYIYIPLGGSRVNHKSRLCFNLLVVWLLTGIWHGADWQFLVWGLLYFVLIAFEKVTHIVDKNKTIIGKLLYRVFVLLFINFQWVLFRSESLSYGLSYLKAMFTGHNSDADIRTVFLLGSYAPVLIGSVIFVFPVGKWIEKRLNNKVANVIQSILMIFLFMVAVGFAMSNESNPFAYANF